MFERVSCLHFQGSLTTLKMEAIAVCKTLPQSYRPCKEIFIQQKHYTAPYSPKRCTKYADSWARYYCILIMQDGITKPLPAS